MDKERAVITIGRERFLLLARQVMSDGDGLESEVRIVAYCPQLGAHFAGKSRKEVWERWVKLIINRG